MVTAGIFPFNENSHGRAGNRTRNLMISSQRLWPLDHEAGPKEYSRAAQILERYVLPLLLSEVTRLQVLYVPNENKMRCHLS